ncbi:hypothetical protein J6590_063129 [Homalodisca vitripennis]|nr:hypothetical protein J6590_063129 [Homalodisca vitripennis]
MVIPEKEVLDEEAVHPTSKKTPYLKGDRANVCLLLYLYMLQGIPLGLSMAIPMILQSKGASYNDQAIYSITTWPFSMKLLWAPIVDAVYCKRFGRRKSWLVPTQYLIGISMLCLSYRADAWIDDPAGPRILILTMFFFVLKVLAATQDVAVDGWVLTMLKRENIGYSSTCGTAGQTAGVFVGFFVFMSLESADFCNAYLRSEPLPYGIITLSKYADIHFVYGLAGGNARLASRLYRERFPDRLHPVHSVFSAVHIRLRETEHLKNNVVERVKSVRTVDFEEEVLLFVEENPSRAFALLLIIWIHQKVQVLEPADFSLRVDCSRWFLHKLVDEPDFLREILPELLEHVPIETRQRKWFQHDGAPAHFSLIARQHLNEVYGDRWMDVEVPSLGLHGFLHYFGWIYLITTTLVMLFKKEETQPSEEEPALGVLETYSKLIQIMRLPTMKTFTILLLTMSISFSACDSISWLKLVRAGLAREKFALATTLIVPVKITLLLIFSSRMTGERSLDSYMKIYPYRYTE